MGKGKSNGLRSVRAKLRKAEFIYQSYVITLHFNFLLPLARSTLREIFTTEHDEFYMQNIKEKEHSIDVDTDKLTTMFNEKYNIEIYKDKTYDELSYKDIYKICQHYLYKNEDFMDLYNDENFEDCDKIYARVFKMEVAILLITSLIINNDLRRKGMDEQFEEELFKTANYIAYHMCIGKVDLNK